jgi:hypothetical protein
MLRKQYRFLSYLRTRLENVPSDPGCQGAFAGAALRVSQAPAARANPVRPVHLLQSFQKRVRFFIWEPVSGWRVFRRRPVNTGDLQRPTDGVME